MATAKKKKSNKKGKGSLELRSVVTSQHRLLLNLIDRAEASPTFRALAKIEQAMTAQLDLEAEILHPQPKKGTSELASYARESHAVIRFALARMCDREASESERHARLRVLRDLFVHHAEREEWLTIERIESEMSDRATLDLAKRLAQPAAAAAAAASAVVGTTRKGK